ncbi:hypothetical protein BDZ89DRAFT_246025 [Hymenopellis radicata]|nr:hypothetical protein BDZ89DRAFT_246025 [Hymenopellis radicata]
MCTPSEHCYDPQEVRSLVLSELYVNYAYSCNLSRYTLAPRAVDRWRISRIPASALRLCACARGCARLPRAFPRVRYGLSRKCASALGLRYDSRDLR